MLLRSVQQTGLSSLFQSYVWIYAKQDVSFQDSMKELASRSYNRETVNQVLKG